MAEEKKRTLNEGKIVSDENAENSIDNNVMASKIDDDTMVLPMIPLRGMNVFPNMVLHFDIGREKSINALEKAMIMDKYIFLAAQKDETTDLPTPDDFYHIGTIGKVKQMLKLPGDSIRVLVEGISRGRIEDVIFEIPYFKCVIKKIEEEEPIYMDPHIEALMRAVIASFGEYVELDPKLSDDVMGAVAGLEEPGRFADFIGSHIDIRIEDKQKLLETFDVTDRLELLNNILSREIEVMKLEHDISSKVKVQMNKNQREYYLREQMRAIQEELGAGEELEDEALKWSEKLKKLRLAKNIEDKMEKEIRKFSMMQPGSAEATVVRTYVETILDLPWRKESRVNKDIKKAENILEADHYGLEKVKERVLEYIAVIQLSKKIKGPIICLVGPPGVGKTSIAKSAARATGRKFVRMSLGGVRDEAEIRGHRRTYIGSIPGRVINLIKEAGALNPVFLFDEVDKIGADFKGDPASALLEVLDPEQNKAFTDHYLEVPFDLSKVMFITTANTAATIPEPLLDRMEVIEVSGYTEEEKVRISEKYLVPKKVAEHGLKEENIDIPEDTLREMINYYTRESGVRNLEREIANLCRKTAKKIVAGEGDYFEITPGNIEDYLGKKRFHYDIIKEEAETGVTTGLAWTQVGGVTLFIETAVVPGTGKIILTGQMGDVMQESATTALSYIRSVVDQLCIDEDFYKEKDIHIHIPEGATPKDGPSAGVTMCLSLISALTGIAAKKDIAMTGEITLRGKVLPVGGIKEKVLAAHRAGIRKVLLPEENKPDIDEIPESVKNEMEFVLIKDVNAAVNEVLIKKKTIKNKR